MRLSWVVAAAVVAVLSVSARDWIAGALLALALAVAYGVLALARPVKPCRRCAGNRRSPRWLGLWGPAGQCRRCRGRAIHERFGAGVVHRFARAAAGELAGRLGRGEGR